MATILTHPDSDGMCSAALILSLYPKSTVFFTKPVSVLSDLQQTKDNKIFICDIAISKSHTTQIMEFLKSSKSEIIWFDHHPLPIEKSKIPCTFVTGEGCTSEIVYKYFEKQMDTEKSFISVYGAIGDYTENTDFIKSKLLDWDARSLHFEASILFLGIKEENFLSYSSKRKIVTALANGKNPSQIQGLLDSAKTAVRKEFALYQLLKTKVQTVGKIAFAEKIPHFGFRGQSALFAATIANKPVGVSVFVNGEKQIIDITMRSRNPSIDLNKLCQKAAESVNGSGGGHPTAAGARIPIGTLEEFLKKVDELI